MAASDPAIAPIMAEHPGAYWTARFLPAKQQWIATLHAKSGKPVLARFTIADGLGTVVSSDDHAGAAGPPATDRRPGSRDRRPRSRRSSSG